MNQQRKPLVIVTGLSGSGLSSVLKTLEDLGFEVFDNFPLPLIRALTDEHTGKGIAPPIALGIDTRTRGFSANTVIEAVQTYNAQLLYITCDENILQKRFTETRRRHPLARDKTVTEGIRQEKALLKDVRDCADLRIDTTELSIHDLRHILEGHFQHEIDNTLTVSLMSFGFRRGVPREADIVMDVRFLQNPHWVKDLKPLSGLDKKVGDYVSKDPDFAEFMENFKTLIAPLIPRYAAEGKSYLTIAIGCTGGRHRSVFTVEELAKWMKTQGHTTHIDHRDLKV